MNIFCFILAFGGIGGVPQPAVPSAAPIFLGTDINQTILMNALLDNRVKELTYGDSSVIKLSSANKSTNHRISNPTRFFFLLILFQLLASLFKNIQFCHLLYFFAYRGHIIWFIVLASRGKCDFLLQKCQIHRKQKRK